MSDRILIEVAIESAADALAAAAGGADRLELCAALDLGGLTPSVGTLAEVRAATGLPVVVMLRPRGGDFVHDASELRAMRLDLRALGAFQPAGYVFGVLQPDGRLDAAACKSLIDAAAGVPCVLHRAFDRTPDWREALETAVELGFARILSSGREERGLAGVPALARLVTAAAGRITILPCGRVRAESAVEIVRLTGCREVHGSFAVPVELPDSRGYRGYAGRSRTGEGQVAAARLALDLYWSASG